MTPSLNFEFLRETCPELADLGGLAERCAHDDPASCLTRCRLLAEQLAMRLCRLLHLPAAGGFLAMLKEIEDVGAAPRPVLDTFHAIRLAGNRAAHVPGAAGDGPAAVRDVFDLARWWRGTEAGDFSVVPKSFVPIPVPASPADLAAAEREMERLRERIDALLQENDIMRRRMAALSAMELDAIRRKAGDAADALKLDEHDTRRRLVDAMLAAAGWNVRDPDQVGLEVDLGPAGRADYVLYNDDGSPLAVLEAKRAATDPRVARRQALDYADALERLAGVRPFVILANGHEIILLDDNGGPDRRIYGIPGRASLDGRIRRRAAMRDPAAVAPNPDIAGRPYQMEAIRAAAEAFGAAHRRGALVVMATGTGKTRVAVSLTDVLIRAGHVRRVLFLCDRRELLRQARNAFAVHLPGRAVAEIGDAPDPAAEIVLATHPAMMRRFRQYDVAWFDLVIADESHRSIYNRHRDLLLHFDALRLGLTATPRSRISHNTYGLFHCADGRPTFSYDYDRAVREGHLADFRPVAVSTKFSREGIHWEELPEKERRRQEEMGLDPDDLDFDAKDLDIRVLNRDTNRRILRNLMDNGLRDGDGGLGRSIVFARSHDHAMLLAELFQECFPAHGPDFCAVIDSRITHAESLLDGFRSPGGRPVVAVSVDMLDTGVDVPEILNLVLARPVRSWVKFWQMIGRGTRLCPNLLGPGRDKEEFLVFDHWGSCEFFASERPQEDVAPAPSLRERLLSARVDLAEAALAAFDGDGFARAAALIRASVEEMPETCLPVMEKSCERLHILAQGVIERFDPADVALLRREVIPLARHIPVTRGDRGALDLDLLVARLQTAVANGGAGAEPLWADLESSLRALPRSIADVRDRFEDIREALDPAFRLRPARELMAALEEKRLALRGIMRHAVAEERVPRPGPLVVDVTDGDVRVAPAPRPILSDGDLEDRRRRVRAILEPRFDSDPVLRRMRRGERLTEDDLAHLAELVRKEDPGLDPMPAGADAAEAERELRAAAGMEDAAARGLFAGFRERNPGLTPEQDRYLNAIIGRIAAGGPLDPGALYGGMFIRLAPDGPESLFDDGQLDDLVGAMRAAAPAA